MICVLLVSLGKGKGMRKRRVAYSNDIPPRSNLTQNKLNRPKPKPVPPGLLDNEVLKQRAEEQQRRQQQSPEGLGQARGPVPELVERAAEAVPAHAREDREGRQRGKDAGERDGGDARADDVRRVTA